MAIQKVAGSERFAYRPSERATLRSKVQSLVPLHDLEEGDEKNALDTLSYEVIRHRLVAITTEMGEALKRMSGSLIVAEANDFNTGIMDEIGDVVSVGLYNTQLTASMDLAIKWTLENRAKSPGINEGDIFLCNDPWIGGGLHQNDVTIFSPLFVDGEIFAWTCSTAHQLDVGSISPGSFSVNSKNVFSESTPIPPIKIVAAGVVQSDVEDAYVRRSRVPNFIALDMRAMIGTNSIAHDRLRSLVSKYGAVRVKAAMRRMMNDAEMRLRTRLKTIPDCVKESVAYVESACLGDREIYKVQLKATKKGDKLILDFRGTSPQVEGFMNCTYAGLRGGVFTVVLPLLCADIPWAIGGIARCFEIITDEGTLNNCEFPAGISKASVGAAWVTQNAAHECLVALMDLSDETRKWVTGLPLAPCVGILSGLDQRGQGFVMVSGDNLAGGFGALPDRDGVDTGGCFCLPMGKIADVEMTEFTTPVLYLWRRERRDSGGAGRYRGGVGGSLAIMLHGVSDNHIHFVATGMGKAVPVATGLSGGSSGAAHHDLIIRGSAAKAMMDRAHMPRDVEELAGDRMIVAVHDESELSADDIYVAEWHGGGGYGDPMLRDPEAVARDVDEGLVSRKAAETVYGVILNGDKADAEATHSYRRVLRMQRAGVNEEAAYELY